MPIVKKTGETLRSKDLVDTFPVHISKFNIAVDLVVAKANLALVSMGSRSLYHEDLWYMMVLTTGATLFQVFCSPSHMP
jgi:hypothetical protein